MNHFEIGDYLESSQCIGCEKDRECVNVTCKAGTFSGPMCGKCLFREAKKRRKPATLPREVPAVVGNGSA